MDALRLEGGGRNGVRLMFLQRAKKRKVRDDSELRVLNFGWGAREFGAWGKGRR